MASNHLLLEALARLEAQLLADFDAVRRIRVLLTGEQPTGAAVSALAALLPGAGAAAGIVAPVQPVIARQPDPVPTYPQLEIRDVKVAVREVVVALAGSFGIGEVKKQLRAQHYRRFSDGSIRTTLQRMEQAGELSLTSQSSGRAGNKYTATINSKPVPAT